MFYLAWVDDGDTTFGPEHYVEAEKFFQWKIEHQEANLAKLTLQIRNPRVGLLSASRKQWAWFSWRKPDNSVVALFHGRILGVPSEIEEDLIQIELLANPPDFEAQQLALAASLRVLPLFDPVFIAVDQLLSPDAVLEGRSAQWHVGRVDKQVTISDMLDGEDGLVVFSAADHFYDGLSISHQGEALRQINVEATVNWGQVVAGQVDITKPLNDAFRVAGSAGLTIDSYTGQGLQSDWRVEGDEIGGGWGYGPSTLTLLSGDGITATWIDMTLTPSSTGDGEDAGEDSVNPFDRARFYLWTFAQSTKLKYAATRQYTEVLTFSLKADVQDMLTTTESPRVQDFKIGSSEVVAALDPEPDSASGTGGSGGVDAAMPIGDLRANTYFNSSRGKQSLAFLIAVARSKLIVASRIVTVTCDIRFADAVDLSCRKSATVEDPRIPGGTAQGKIVAYTFGLDGSSGELYGSLVIGCAVGRGNTLGAPADGVPTYADASYTGADYQFYDGADVEVFPSEVTYRNYSRHIRDDGLNFFSLTPASVIQRLQVFNGSAIQAAMLSSTTEPDIPSAVKALNDIFTYYELNLVPIATGPYTTPFPVVVSNLMIPRMIDMEAA